MDMNKKYVWYACYCSNILRERFMLYIKGGFCRFNNGNYIPCNDKSAPLEDKPINIPYKLYFGNNSEIPFTILYVSILFSASQLSTQTYSM